MRTICYSLRADVYLRRVFHISTDDFCLSPRSSASQLILNTSKQSRPRSLICSLFLWPRHSGCKHRPALCVSLRTTARFYPVNSAQVLATLFSYFSWLRNGAKLAFNCRVRASPNLVRFWGLDMPENVNGYVKRRHLFVYLPSTLS